MSSAEPRSIPGDCRSGQKRGGGHEGQDDGVGPCAANGAPGLSDHLGHAAGAVRRPHGGPGGARRAQARVRQPGILGPGHFMGEGCLNGHPLRIATARAVECVITRIKKATMLATIHAQPDFSELFMAHLLTGTVA